MVAEPPAALAAVRSPLGTAWAWSQERKYRSPFLTGTPRQLTAARTLEPTAACTTSCGIWKDGPEPLTTKAPSSASTSTARLLVYSTPGTTTTIRQTAAQSSF